MPTPARSAGRTRRGAWDAADAAAVRPRRPRRPRPRPPAVGPRRPRRPRQTRPGGGSSRPEPRRPTRSRRRTRRSIRTRARARRPGRTPRRAPRPTNQSRVAAPSRDASDYDPATRNDTGQNDWLCAACGADNSPGASRVSLRRRARRATRRRTPTRPRAGRRVVQQVDGRRAARATRHVVFHVVLSVLSGGGHVSVLRHVSPRSRARRRGRAFVSARGRVRRRRRFLRGFLRRLSARGVPRERVAEKRHSRVGGDASRVVGPGRPRGRVRVRVRARRRAVVGGGSDVRRSTFSVESRVWSCAGLTSTRLASTRAKDAVCDALVDANGWRPPPPRDGHASADVPMFLSLYRDEAVLYRDMSGDSLHRRGYRDAAVHRAALNESAAAGLLSIAGWSSACEASRAAGGAGYRLPTLVDPMCGSGTILVEAALMAGHVAPGLVRTDAASARGTGFHRLRVRAVAGPRPRATRGDFGTGGGSRRRREAERRRPTS